jgi:hypothetical protein
MMMRRLLIALALLLLLAAPALAQHTVSGEYDLLTGLWSWEAAGSKPVTDWLSVGYTLTAVCDGAIYKAGIVPSWVPVRQDYAIWLQATCGAWSVRVTDWCNHWLSQSGKPPASDTWGLRVRVQWEW